MEHLAQETRLNIFQFLSPSNTLQVCLTCKEWRNDWMKSFKAVAAQTRQEPNTLSQLKLGIAEGRTAFVDRLLRDHPHLFYPPHCSCKKWEVPHPLELVAPTRNLEMLKIVWISFVSHEFSALQLQQLRIRQHQEIPHAERDIFAPPTYCRRYLEDTTEVERERGAAMAAKKMFEEGSAEMLRFLCSTSVP